MPPAASEAAPQSESTATSSCLVGRWTQEPTGPPAPNACDNCPKTSYELGAPERNVFPVHETGIVRRSGKATESSDVVVFEMMSPENAVLARFACKTIEACHRMRCTWSVGGAGDGVLVK